MRRYLAVLNIHGGKQVAAVFLAVLLGLADQALAQERQLLISAEEASRISQSEEQLKQLIQTELNNANPLFQGRKPTSLSGREAVMKGLEKNLSLRRGRLSDSIAEAALQEARAVFDPVLLLSLGYERSQSYDRVESAKRYQSSTVVNENGENVLEVDEALDPRAPIVVFSEPRNEGFFDADVLASQESITGADERLSLGAGLEQLLPWGGSLLISYTAINQDRFFINNAQIYSGSANPDF
ncbi:MAG: hypothetical protein KDJ38_03980, partial [Gammaproteobacteria bacterium]|nr:hypothetical protein [Gammaproteobacteria bacterium]